MSNEVIKILDVKINVISKSEVLDKIKNLLTPPFKRPTGSFEPTLDKEGIKEGSGGEQLVTTNPEFIVAAQKDEEFKNVINNSWLSVADGYGIRLAAKYQEKIKNKKSKIKNKVIILFLKLFYGLQIAWWGITRNDKKLDVVEEVITGTDLMPEICKFKIYDLRFKIFLLGGYGEVPKLTAEVLRRENPNLQIDYSVFEVNNVIEKINQVKPAVLFVALNHPKAQKWIDKNLERIPSVKLAIGVGGAFNYISGKIKRAPQGMRYSFEWMFRLLMQPKRWKRIWNAVIVFPWKIFMSSIKKNNENLLPVVNENDEIIGYKKRELITYNDIYRVSALWVTDSKNRILLAQRSLNKKHDPGMWGPAVAGTVEKGENYETNILKEMDEELCLKGYQLFKGPKLRVSNIWNHFTQWYTLKIDRKIEDFKIKKDEIEQIKWFEPNEFIKELEDNPNLFLKSMPRLKKIFLNK